MKVVNGRRLGYLRTDPQPRVTHIDDGQGYALCDDRPERQRRKLRGRRPIRQDRLVHPLCPRCHEVNFGQLMDRMRAGQMGS